jgi:rod shape determining protein RodA
MVSGILPVVGVTLPLISYGGSSVLTIMVALGLVMNVSVRRFAY